MKDLKTFIVILLVVLLTVTGCSNSNAKTDAPLGSEEQQNSDNQEIVNNAESNKEKIVKEESEEETNENANTEKNENNESSENNLSEEEANGNQAETDETDEDNTAKDLTNPETSNNVSDNLDKSGETTSNLESDLENNINEQNSNDLVNQNVESQEPEKPAENSLKIEGLVETELSFTLDDLKKLEGYIFEDDFYSLNSFGTTGYTHFKGINLWSLLEDAAISSDAAKVTVIAQDGYSMEFTVDQVKKQDYIDETNPDKKYPMIIAWEENEEEYDSAEGAPFKLVVGQKEAGDVNKPQWVSNIDKIVIE